MGVINRLQGWEGRSPLGSTPITVWMVADPLDFASITGSKEGDIGYSTDGSIYRRLVGTSGWTLVFDPSVGGGGAAWGSITGVLSAQTDLQSALDGKSNTGHTHAEGDVTNLTADLAGKAALVHTHVEGDVTNLVADLAAKQPLDSNLTTIAGLTATTDNVIQSVASAWASRTPAQLKTTLALVKADVGLGSVDNTSDAAKPVSTATQTALDLKANLAGPTFTGVPAAPTAAADTNTTQLATTAFVIGQAGANNPLINGTAAPGTSKKYSREDHVHPTDTTLTTLALFDSRLGVYRTILQANGSHIAGRVAGTYALTTGNPIAITGTGTLYPLALFQIVAADYPTIHSLAPKFRMRVVLNVNDVAPTGNFTFGLYPVTRPATSGGAGLDIYTMGTVVTGSTVAINTPAADSQTGSATADFALPADGFYVIGVVTTATVAVSSHLHMNAVLQVRNA